jgi:hypothetical protein
VLHNNGSYPIVACVSVAAEMCLAIRCLTMGMAQTTQKTFLAMPFLLLLARIAGVA